MKTLILIIGIILAIIALISVVITVNYHNKLNSNK